MATATTFDQELYNAALTYLDVGLSLIPISPQTKRPIEALLPMDPETGRGSWKIFQERQPTQDEVRCWIERGAFGLAVVCGQASGGLLVLDFDEPRFFTAWQQAVGSLADGLPVQRTGGGGYQVFLRCPDPGRNDHLAWLDDAGESSGRRIAIETRAEGGYAVIPPSLHRSGMRYSWLAGSLSTDKPVDMLRSQAVADALLAAARKLDEAPYTKAQLKAMADAMLHVSPNRQALNGHSSAIDQYNSAVSIDEALQKNGYRHCYGSRYARPGGTNPSVVVQNGKSFHHNSNDPLCDGHWHDAFDLFCFFEHHGDAKAAAKEAAIWLAMPPLAQTTAIPQHGATGVAPNAQNPQSSPANPQSSASASGPVPMPWQSLGSLLAKQFPEPTWIIPDLLSAGVTLCAGRPKRARKSWLMLNLAIAVAGDGQTLGGLDVTHGDVLYLALEDSDRRLQSRVEKMLAGGPAPTAHAFDFATSWDRFDQLGLQQMELWLQTHPAARLVVVDTLAKVRPPQKPGSVYDQDYAALHGLMQLAKRYTDVAFIVVHHTRKASTEDALEEISGSFGLTGGVDDTWIIKRDGEDAILHAIGRNLPRERDVALQWHDDTATWTIAGEAEDYQVSKQRQEILDLLDGLDDGLSPADIAGALGRLAGTVRKMLFMMVKDHQVERRGNGRYVTSSNGNAGNGVTPVTGNAPASAPAAPQPVQQSFTTTIQEIDIPEPAAAAPPASQPSSGSSPRQHTSYDHDRNRVREARKLARAGKYDKAKFKAQSVRSKKSKETLLDWIARLERGEASPDEDDTP